jgi:hypothetical protein
MKCEKPQRAPHDELHPSRTAQGEWHGQSCMLAVLQFSLKLACYLECPLLELLQTQASVTCEQR